MGAYVRQWRVGTEQYFQGLQARLDELQCAGYVIHSIFPVAHSREVTSTAGYTVVAYRDRPAEEVKRDEALLRGRQE